MDLLRHWMVEVCNECGREVSDGEHATSSHQNGPTHWVEVVPASRLRGAVEAGAALAALLERPDAEWLDWPARDALAAWRAAVGPTTAGGQ